ncbi:tRNA (adenosine(37)-N6)-threonylcarbamoyltransferase complex dimerization subunit type 1 TsaB [uncultured Actinomyces sp.]|uniref:tRNA (adenosine(37)-N6)-threonylcarbamoyltransferase complex dimerization subunit type 1 TsaB n=1 Tax=uncultured Actinomyces sp. TaxID=249061 RepID=UPI00260F2178|nr:tRNA (adenosine(37)-N6)-threonylcarbamoyltransferase complex dimerization subunit type 1 TsaB [uncultured Actinomyces sp.]
MKDLCIDTSGGAVVAVVTEGATTVNTEPNSRAHAERLAELISLSISEAGLGKTVKEAGLDQVIVGTGPAPFTGLRAGLVTARVIGRVAGIPVRGIGSLEVLARSYLDDMPPGAEVVVTTDARRHEVYWAHIRAAGPNDVEVIEGPAVNTADCVANKFRAGDVEFVGPACQLYPDAFPSTRGTAGFDVAVASRIVRARLDNGIEDFPVDPQYLRRPDIHGEKK